MTRRQGSGLDLPEQEAGLPLSGRADKKWGGGGYVLDLSVELFFFLFQMKICLVA